MRVLLVAPRDLYVPTGMAYVSAALKEAGHAVTCCHHDVPGGIANLARQGYDIVGTGGMCVHYRQVAGVVAAAWEARKKVMVGGNIITAEPALMSGALGADYAVIGQGEETAVELLRCLEEGGDASEVAGVGTWRDGEFICSTRRIPAQALDDLPWPDYEAFGLAERLDRARPSDPAGWDVFDFPREYVVTAARSCPYQCTFCYHPEGEKYRQRSVASLMAELREVVPRYRINLVTIQDDLFSADGDRVRQFCAEFSAFAATLPWEVKWGCQMRVDGLTDQVLDAMRDSGCHLVGYGLESYSPVVLRSMRKGITPEQIHYAVHATLDRRIGIEAHFIFGDPAETLETAQETLSFWREHMEAGIYLDFVRVYPNSALYRGCLQRGLITDRLEYAVHHLGEIINLTGLSAGEFEALKAMVVEAEAGVKRTLIVRRTGESLTVKCPHCREVSTYGNYESSPLLRRSVLCRHCRKRIPVESRAARAYHSAVGRALRRVWRRLRGRAG